MSKTKKTNDKAPESKGLATAAVRRKPIIIKSGGIPLVAEREQEKSKGGTSRYSIAVGVPKKYSQTDITDASGNLYWGFNHDPNVAEPEPIGRIVQLEIVLVVDGVRVTHVYECTSFECEISTKHEQTV